MTWAINRGALHSECIEVGTSYSFQWHGVSFNPPGQCLLGQLSGCNCPYRDYSLGLIHP